MKKLLILSIVFFALMFCTPKRDFATQRPSAESIGDTVRIANDDLGYEIIIIDPGFTNWMATNARPRGYHSQTYLENRNLTWVLGWNERARNPQGGAAYLMPIDYQNGVNYGYEVNYLLYNYLTYFQIKNNIRLGGYVPRI